MAGLLNISMSAAQVISALQTWATANGLTPSPALSTEMSATQFEASVNGLLGTDVAASDSAATAIGKINTAVENYIPPVSLESFKFLHTSDTHGCPDSLNSGQSIMAQDNSVSFLIDTGDNGMTSDMRSAAANVTAGDFLAINGNHDVVNMGGTRLGYEQIRQNMDGFLVRSGVPTVEYGHEGYGCYWHKDYWLDESHTQKLRVFGIDQYNDEEGKAVTGMNSHYTQDQLDWFIDKLTELDGNDYFVIALHETPMTGTPSNWARRNPFCSSRSPSSWGNTSSKPTLFPEIVDAYLEHKTFNKTYSYSDDDRFLVNEDFRNIPSAKFLCYISGHEHWDFVGYNNSYSKQLVICADTAYRLYNSAGHDIGSGSAGSDIRIADETSTDRFELDDFPGARGTVINLIEFDFARGKIRIERKGQQITVQHRVGNLIYDVGVLSDQDELISQANAFVHGGGYYDFVNSEYHATNDDGSVNDDVDYVSGEIVVNTYTTSSGQQKTEYSFDVDHVLVYTYENGALVAKVDGVSVDPSTIVRSDYRLRRKKISFPLQKTTT